MASTVLPNGIIIPEKYSRDWYADLYHNWQELDNLLGGGTPKDGTLTIQKNGTTVGTFSANQATDETINIEVPDVNNGTLTIQQNGTTVDTFTANSSSDKTVNISVPTNTNELTNGAGFITADYAVPRSGGAVLEGYLYRTTNTSAFVMGSGTAWNGGASIELYGAEYPETFNRGRARIQPASLDSIRRMDLMPDGTWTWNGTACQIISDQRLKKQIAEIDDKLLDAW